VVTVNIDPESGMPATAQCPKQGAEVFIAGTEPVGTCPLHGGNGDRTTVSGWDTGEPASQQATSSRTVEAEPPAGQPRPRRSRDTTASAQPAPNPTAPNTPPAQQPKKGILGRLLGIFK
jgi:hypothetical protein